MSPHFYFLSLLIFSATLSHAQVSTSSPLMMLRGKNEIEHHTDQTRHYENLSVQRRSERPPAQESFSTPAENDNTTESSSLPDLKSREITSITAKIEFLRTSYPDKIHLILILESYLEQYKESLNISSFDEWISDFMIEKQRTIMELQEAKPSAVDFELQNILSNIVISEQKILNALLSTLPNLEMAEASYQIREIHLQAKDAIQKRKSYVEQYSNIEKAIQEYLKADTERSRAKRAYYDAKEEAYRWNWSPNKTEKEITPLYTEGIQKKKIFKEIEKKFTSTYQSLELAKKRLKENCSAAHALKTASLYFRTVAMTLVDFSERRLPEEEVACYKNSNITRHLLAQDHVLLASKIVEGDQSSIDELHKSIAIALEAKFAFDCQLSVLEHLKGLTTPNRKATLPPSLSLFEQAGCTFLSAYHALKHDRQSTLSEKLKQEAISLMYIAHIFQIAPIQEEKKKFYSSDLLTTIERAQFHAQSFVDGNQPNPLYHQKIAHFLYEKFVALNSGLEIAVLKRNHSPESPAFSLLEQAATLFERARFSFDILSQLSFDEFESSETQLLIETANKTKNRASQLFSQIKKISAPDPTVSTTFINQDLLSWSD